MSVSRSRMPVVVLNDTRVDRHHGCTRVMGAIESLISSSGMQLLASSPAHSDWSRDHAFLSAMQKARLVIVNGEGTIHHDRASGLSLLSVAAHSRSLGIPAALINCGWECNGSQASERLGDFTLVSARDSASAEDIRAAGMQCGVVPDLSLFLPVVPALAPRNAIGFTDSVVRASTVRLESLRKQANGIQAPIQYSLPGVLGSYRYYREYLGVSDLVSPAFLARLLVSRAAQFQAQVGSAEQYLALLAGLRLLVSGRFHACTLALLTLTPFLAVSSNSRKIESLVMDAGLDARRVVADPSGIEPDQLSEYGWSSHELKSIADYLHSSRIKANQLFRDLSALG